MRRILKALALFSALALSIVVLALVRLIFFFHPEQKKRVTANTVYLFGKLFVFIIDVKVKLSGETDLLRKKGVFFVSNHFGYIDGIIASSLTPLVFIAKSDLRNWPFFGFFSFLSDTIFVNRTSPAKIKKEIDRIVSFLNTNVNVILFPEGTSTDGSRLLPFKSSFFAAPQAAESLIVPLAITYDSVDNQKLSEENKDLLHWYGTMDFFTHLLKVLSLRKIVINVKVCRAIQSYAVSEDDLSLQRKTLRDTCWSVIDKNLNLIPQDSFLAS